MWMVHFPEKQRMATNAGKQVTRSHLHVHLNEIAEKCRDKHTGLEDLNEVVRVKSYSNDICKI